MLLIVNPFAGAFKLLYDNCDGFKNKVDDMIRSVIATFKKLPGEMINIGKNIVEGLWEGIKNASSWLKNKINEFGNTIINSIKDKFEINSPSRVFMGIGEYITEGLSEGIKAGTNGVLDKMSNLQENMIGIQSSVYPANAKEARTDNPVSARGGDTYIFNSPKALTASESRRQMQKAKRAEALSI